MNSDFWYKALLSVQNDIRLADNKVNFLLAFYSTLFGIFLAQLEKYLTILTKFNFFVLLITILGGVFIYSVIRFFFYFYKTVHPRTKPQMLVENIPKSKIFWGEISFMELDKFKSEAKLLDNDKILEEILNQLYVNSKIANDKFYNVKEAYNLIPFTLITFILYFALLRFGG